MACRSGWYASSRFSLNRTFEWIWRGRTDWQRLWRIVTVCDISWYRGTDVESWITSDGRAYFVQLTESAYSDVNVSNPDVNGEDSLPVRML